MFFQNLSKELQIQIYKLTTDEEFQQRFASDEILNELQKQKDNQAEDFADLLLVLSLSDKFITPAKWSYLWAIQSPFLTDQQFRQKDVDLFLYIIDNRLRK